jgi:hypothetical protein
MPGLVGGHVRLRWAAPPVGDVATYDVFRVLGLPSDIGRATRVGIVTAPQAEFLDTSAKLFGSTYTYFVVAVAVEGTRSPQSNLAVTVIQ